MVAHIGDYPLASELMASQATILPLYTLRAECRQRMDWEEASVRCYLAICRVGGGVTHQQASCPKQAGEAKMLLQGHFSVLDPSMHCNLIYPCCYPGKQEVIPMQCSLKNSFLSAMRKYLMRARQV